MGSAVHFVLDPEWPDYAGEAENQEAYVSIDSRT